MWYYLETNALIALGSAISQVSRKTYTSFWAISELLKGLDAERYARQHNLAAQIVKSGIRIDWTDHLQKLCEAFGRRCPALDLTDVVQGAFNLMAEVPNYDLFENQIHQHGLSDELAVLFRPGSSLSA